MEKIFPSSHIDRYPQIIQSKRDPNISTGLYLGQINIMGRILSLLQKRIIGQHGNRDVFATRIIGAFHYKGC